MDAQTIFIVILGVLIVLIVGLLMIWRASTSLAPEEQETHLDRLDPLLVDARLDDGEEQASPISEEIEGMVQKQLAQYPDLAGQVIDFGTAADGSLEIWIGGKRYENVSDIPDVRVREAITEAVNKFNRASG